MKTEAAEIAAASVASKSTYVGAGSMVLGWMTSSEAAVLFGILVGLGGLLVNIYYKAKSSARFDRECALRRRETESREALDRQRLEESRVRTELMRATGRPIHPPAGETAPGALEGEP